MVKLILAALAALLWVTTTAAEAQYTPPPSGETLLALPQVTTLAPTDSFYVVHNNQSMRALSSQVVGTTTGGVTPIQFGGICDGNTANAAANDVAVANAIASLPTTLIIPSVCALTGTRTFSIPGNMSLICQNGGGFIFPTSATFTTGFQLFKWTSASATGVNLQGCATNWNGSTVTIPSPKGPVYSLFYFINCTDCKILRNSATGQPPSNVIDIFVVQYNRLEIASNSFVQTGTSIHHQQCINTGSVAPLISYNLDEHDNVCDGTGIFNGGDSYHQHIYHNTAGDSCFGGAITTEGESSYTTDYDINISDNILSWNNVCPSYDDNSTRQEGIENFYENAVIQGNKIRNSPGPCIDNSDFNVLIDANVCVDGQNLPLNPIYRLTVTGGSGNTQAQYKNVALTTTSGVGTSATANINVGSDGACDVISVLSPGFNFAIGDTLSAPASALGGAGTGCAFSVAAIQGGEGIYVNHSNPGQGPALTLGTLVGGSGGAPGTYNAVPLTGSPCQSVTANITIGVGGSVTTLPTLVSNGVFCTPGTVLTTSVGGLTGFSVTVTRVSIWTANNTTIQGNTVIEDGLAGNMSYCFGDLFTGGVFTNMGTNTCLTPQIGAYNFAGTLNYLTTPSTDNRIYNGCDIIDTRNAGAAVTASGAYGPDGWKLTASLAGRLSMQQVQLPSVTNAECTEALTVTQTSASPILSPTGDLEYVSQYIELSSLLDAQYNTPTPQSYVLSFCVNTSVGGQWSVAVENQNTAASYVTIFRALSGTTNCPQIVIPGDTSHTLGFTYTNAGLRVIFDLGSNQSVCTSTLNTWQGAYNYCATNTNSLLAAAQNATYTITNVSLVPATNPVAVQVRPLAQEIDYAQRYASTSFLSGTKPAQNVGVGTNEVTFLALASGAGALVSNPIVFPQPMRTTPTTPTLYSPGNATADCWDETASIDAGAATVQALTAQSFRVSCAGNASVAAKDVIGIHWFATAAF